MVINDKRIIFFKPKLNKAKAKSLLIGKTIGFYRRYIKKIKLIRFVVIKIYNVFLSIRNVKNKIVVIFPCKKLHKVVSLDEYLAKSKASYELLFPAEKIKKQLVEVLPRKHSNIINEKAIRCNFPDIYKTTLSEATIFSNSGFILKDDVLIHHNLMSLDRDLTSEELHNRIYLHKDNKAQLRSLGNDDNGYESKEAQLQSSGRDGNEYEIKEGQVQSNNKYDVKEAASFSDSCSINYAHWMTEVLPRISAFCSVAENNNIPIIVDHVHSNMLESLLSIIPENQKVIVLPPNVSVKVSKLHVVSCCGYVPFDFRKKLRGAPEHQGEFSPALMLKIRNDILKYCCEDDGVIESHKKIYFKRNTAGKQSTNIDEVEEVLKNNGFFFVDPQNLSFREQVQICSEAEVVISSSGAALTNMMFLPLNSKVYILMGCNKILSYSYWINIANIFGHKVTYLLGEVPYYDRKSNQPDFKVSIKNLIKVLET
ncbi:glycosyltransferase family 61 protein [Vibrio coralliilyticus]|uniref:glycosyltransferase family 61 protein n=1 Tax=Vibrio coralliilyticus TaxID=190893 RepID=UPI00148BD779|nr:glycosyltransferase family 61 protein [Vibrio coralliilyticus]NOI30714.1 glycosyltransferase family 61 protein [Vibrio coralliilyticus]NOI49738.1 glycosyltransferase family 61 protein [Vibrio coralliilyticus]WFB48030.1 glycosyltransferase family 61 protein [Vibrio coralliilyticus]